MSYRRYRTYGAATFASDLSRPVDYFSFWLSRDLGRAAYHTLYRALPTFLLGLLFFHVRPPASPLHALAFVLSLLLAIILSFCFRFIFNVIGFWTTDVRGIMGLAMLFVNFLTGFLIPLEFFPPAIRDVVLYLPFAAMISIPTRIYLGQITTAELPFQLGLQIGWVVVLVTAAQVLVQRATQKLVVQGG
jgi:ABC-2 type transport system permease protein